MKALAKKTILKTVLSIFLLLLIAHSIALIIPNKYAQILPFGIAYFIFALFLREKDSVGYKHELLSTLNCVGFVLLINLFKDFGNYLLIILGIGGFSLLYFLAWRHRND